VGALIVTPDALTAGASGAVFGLMGATFLVMHNRGVNPWQSGLGIWLLLNLAITFTVSNISIGGHIGGLIGGAVAGWLVVELPDRRRLPRWTADVVAAGLAVVAFVAAIAVA
jgi:membrane associated rhomboid family serine protease